MGSTISLILLNKNPSTIAIGGHTSTPPSETLFWWNIPAWNPNVSSSHSLNTNPNPNSNTNTNPNQMPLNYAQAVTVPLTTNDLMNLNNNQIPQITKNNMTYYQLMFPNTNLKIPGPGVTPTIIPSWSLLAIPTSYIVSNTNSAVILNVPSTDIVSVQYDQISIINSHSNGTQMIPASGISKTSQSVVHFHIYPKNVQIKQTGITQAGLPVYQINML